MQLEAIQFDVEDHVATITLNRPDALNAFDDAMGAELEWAWAKVRDDDGINVAVVRSSSDRAFCAGRDVHGGPGWYAENPNVWNRFDPGTTVSPKQHHKVWKPVVVAVNGICAGGGQYLLNEADIILCSEDATFFDPHANIGIVSALEGIGMRARGVPIGDVLRWALMGTEERITAATALRIGLVTEVVPSREALWARADEIGKAIAARPTAGIQGTVRAIWETMDVPRSVAQQLGILYTHIGNPPYDQWAVRNNGKPTFR